MRLFEWHDSPFDVSKERREEFVRYLAGAWQNRNRYVAHSDEVTDEERQEEQIQKQRFFDFTVDGRISARNYVGVVQHGDIRIEVYPKIFADDVGGNPGKWQLNLLYWLMYCRKIKFPFAFADVSKLQFDDYLELLICIFANYAEEVLSRQPFQAYQSIEEETVFLKGHLSFDNYIKHNLSTGKWQKFYCDHQPLIYDNLFNRIVKYVSRRLLAISQNSLNREKLNEVLFLLDDVSDIRCSASDCDKIRLNPLYDEHRQILDLCRMYLSNQVIDMESENSRNFCFLVPMEYIFEDFIFGFIVDKWPTLSVQSQSIDFLALNQGQKVFQIRNDIYINKQLIIDTKYKIRYTDGTLKNGVSQNDLYQMVSYALRRNCKDVLLLYPHVSTALNSPTDFKIPSAMLSDDIGIGVRSINITFKDISKADGQIINRIQSLHSIFL